MARALSPSCFGPYHAIGADSPYDDVVGDVSQGAANSSLTYEAFRDTPYLAFFFRHDQDDTLCFRFQMPHSWDPTTDVHMHIHLMPMVDPLATQVVRFAGQYAWATGSTLTPANAGWVQFVTTVDVNPGDAFRETITGMFTVTPPATAGESDILLVYLKRTGTDPGDTYTTGKASGTAAANLCLLSADCHIQKNKIGTDTQYPTNT